MRLLLAAIRCEKADVGRNLTEHRRVMTEARRAGCTLAVLPEMSLTGSIDPVRDPESLATLDDPAVHSMVQLTSETGVAAVFGIAERAASGAGHITQVVADDGRVAGVQRKRYLGDDERGYTPATGDELFDIAGIRFTIAICAEVHHDEPFSFAHDAGAQMVFACAAPGLSGRRTDDEGRRSGWQWWVDSGLADVQRHAKEHQLPIALATQAGSTRDEDFPGGAALVDADGAVSAQLPDWRPGTLVVDV